MDRRRFLSIVAFGALAAPAVARADDDDDDRKDDDRKDADRVLQDRTRGVIKPLKEIIEIVQHTVPGRIVETEFKYKKGIPVYEFYVLQSGGKRREVKVDGRDGRIIEIDED